MATMRILVIEDEEHLARLIAEVLIKEGYLVETVKRATSWRRSRTDALG